MGNPNMARNYLFDLTCQDCGKTFQCKVSFAKYCPECREIRKQNRFKRHFEHPYHYKKKVCECCGKVFQPTATNVKLCDDCKAYKKHLQSIRRPILKCKYCGEYYIPTGNHQDKCPLCRFKQIDSTSYRGIAFSTFPHVCNRCGKPVDIFTGDVHHKDRNRDNNDPSNLELLCKSCHHKEHMVRDPKTGKILHNI